MDQTQFKQRTQAFALRVIRLVESLPKSGASGVIGRQLLRRGTSVGANYRSACRAKSQADFVSKMGIVEEESDECINWMELLIETGYVKVELLADLMREAEEILSMVVASIKTARRGKQSAIRNPQ